MVDKKRTKKADNPKETSMGLTTWKDAPRVRTQKFDISVAKNS